MFSKKPGLKSNSGADVKHHAQAEETIERPKREGFSSKEKEEFEKKFQETFNNLDSDKYIIRQQASNDFKDMIVPYAKKMGELKSFIEKIGTAVEEKDKLIGIGLEQKDRANKIQELAPMVLTSELAKEIEVDISLGAIAFKSSEQKNENLENFKKLGKLIGERPNSIDLMLEAYITLPEALNDHLGAALASVSRLLPQEQEILLKDSNSFVREALASNPNISLELQRKLLQDDDFMVRQTIFTKEDLDPKLIHDLLASNDVLAQRYLARRSDLNPEILKTLANSPSELVREDLALNPSTPPEILTRMIGDTEPDVAAAAASNKNLPEIEIKGLINRLEVDLIEGKVHPKIFQKLTQNLSVNTEDMEKIVKLGQSKPPTNTFNDYSHEFDRLGYSKEASPILLRILATQNEPNLRAQAGKHSNTPYEVLEKLAGDPEDLVKACVVSNIKCQIDTRKSIYDSMSQNDYHVPRAFASNPSTGPEILVALSNHRSDHVRTDVARHPSTPPAIRNRLAFDNSGLVRQAARQKPLTTNQLTEQLINKLF